MRTGHWSCTGHKAEPVRLHLCRYPKDYVATPKAFTTQLFVATLRSLSRHRVSHLCRDRAPKEACRDRSSHACLRARRRSIVRTGSLVALPRRSCHDTTYSVATQNWKWAVAHPIWSPAPFLSIIHIVKPIENCLITTKANGT